MPNLVGPFKYFLVLSVTGYAIFVYAFLPLGMLVHPDMKSSFAAHPTVIYLHIFASCFALALGLLQFNARLREKYRVLHRCSGRLYLGVGVLMGGLAGLYMAYFAYGGAVAKLGFACLALSWLYTGLRAYIAIRSGSVIAHQRWMKRNYALTLAAVTLRIYLPLAMVAGFKFELAYAIIAWLCWVPNLLFVEFDVCKNRVLPLMKS